MTNKKRFNSLFRSLVRIMIGVLIGIMALLVLLYIFQDRMIFFPERITAGEAEWIARGYSQRSQIENIILKIENDVSIRGWLVKNSTQAKSPLIIYFGGNAEELSYLIHYADKIKGWSLALINYRGYGLSEGKPTEKNLKNDALAIYDYFARRKDIDNKKIVVMGRSLGTGVAVYLASMRDVKAVILVSPFDSLVSVAKRHYPVLPVGLLLRHRFDSISRAPHISVPLLALAASKDTIIPLQFSKRLSEKWGGPHSLKVINGEDHNTIHDNAEYWKSIQDFLSAF